MDLTDTHSKAETMGDPVVSASSWATLKAYFELTKPGLMTLVVVTTLLGIYLGISDRIAPKGAILLTMLGTSLTGGGACALNMYIERFIDTRMRRTRSRPLPMGILKPRSVLLFGLGLIVLGASILWFWAHPLTALLSLIAAFTYVSIYTPLKTHTPWATLIGAIPGALPPLMGWSAIRHDLAIEGWLVFAILFFWQLPHFWALSILYREEFEQAELKVCIQNDPLFRKTAWYMVLATTLLIVASSALFWVGALGAFYEVGSLFLGLIFWVRCYQLFHNPSRGQARKIFFTSLIYLPALIALMVTDKPHSLIRLLGLD